MSVEEKFTSKSIGRQERLIIDLLKQAIPIADALDEVKKSDPTDEAI